MFGKVTPYRILFSLFCNGIASDSPPEYKGIFMTSSVIFIFENNNKRKHVVKQSFSLDMHDEWVNLCGDRCSCSFHSRADRGHRFARTAIEISGRWPSIAG